MVDVDPDQLRQAVENQHGGKATYVESVPMAETFHGKKVWEGTVVVFDLDGCPNASRAYAWSLPIEGSTKRRYFAVLHLGGIRSPQDAVRAAIFAEYRKTKTIAALTSSRPFMTGIFRALVMPWPFEFSLWIADAHPPRA